MLDEKQLKLRQFKPTKEQKHNKSLIDWGAAMIVAEVDHMPKPFIIGLLRKCRREIIPKLSDAEMDAIKHDGFVAMQVRKYKGKIEGGNPTPEAKPTKKKYFYQIEKPVPQANDKTESKKYFYQKD